ncbi:hypothetical protein F2Q68_00010172 [Brassica cretica]|uniref:Uncharacterized protein n=1 Tax=Brassica cretica TaxID=69181 RepID=A0A3N6U0J4_BRACR|nr:hypothetical protein F2Q68_00010172 [Brassica cretica]
MSTSRLHRIEIDDFDRKVFSFQRNYSRVSLKRLALVVKLKKVKLLQRQKLKKSQEKLLSRRLCRASTVRSKTRIYRKKQDEHTEDYQQEQPIVASFIIRPPVWLDLLVSGLRLSSGACIPEVWRRRCRLWLRPILWFPCFLLYLSPVTAAHASSPFVSFAKSQSREVDGLPSGEVFGGLVELPSVCRGGLLSGSRRQSNDDSSVSPFCLGFIGFVGSLLWVSTSQHKGPLLVFFSVVVCVVVSLSSCNRILVCVVVCVVVVVCVCRCVVSVVLIGGSSLWVRRKWRIRTPTPINRNKPVT